MSPAPFLRACTLLLFLAWAVPVSAQQAVDTVTVDVGGAIVQALEASPEVGANVAQREFAEARSQEARASRFLTDFQATTAHAAAPGLNIPDDYDGPLDALYLDPDVRNDWDDLRPFNRLEIEALQPIWTWGQLGGSIRAARFGVEVEEAAVEEQASTVALRTGELYYGLLLARALDDLTEEAGDIVEQAQSEVQRLIDEGDAGVDEADLFQVQLTQQEYNRRVVEVEQRLETARIALVRQLFLPETTVIAPEDATLEPVPFTRDSLDVYTALALANRPELARARAGLAARGALVEVARSDYYPKLFLSVSSSYAYAAGRERQPNPYVGDPFIGRSLRAGVGFRQELNFLQTRARIEQAQAERNQVRYQQEAAQQLILFQVEEAYRNVIIAEAALQAQDESLTISRNWLRSEQVNFDLELGDTENLVDAVRANLELQVAYSQAVQNYNVVVLRLFQATGTLTDRARNGMFVGQP